MRPAGRSVDAYRLAFCACFGQFLVCWAMATILVAAQASRPNIVVIVGDDMGYADIGVHGCTDIPTPNIDALANAGVRCTSGYVSGPYCSPTRAGLLTGRYQTRFGHEFNPGNNERRRRAQQTAQAEQESQEQQAGAGRTTTTWRLAPCPVWIAAFGNDDRRSVEGGRLCDGHGRQVASGRRQPIPSTSSAASTSSSASTAAHIRIFPGRGRRSSAATSQLKKRNTSPTPLPARRSRLSTSIARSRSSCTWHSTPCTRPCTRPTSAGEIQVDWR